MWDVYCAQMSTLVASEASQMKALTKNLATLAAQKGASAEARVLGAAASVEASVKSAVVGSKKVLPEAVAPAAAAVVPAVAAAAAAAACDFQSGVDYADPGADSGIEGLSQQGCCEHCAAMNLQAAGACVVAVYSASYDSPANACWTKTSAKQGRKKRGVNSCWPAGHPSFPELPKEVGGSAAAGRWGRRASSS
jgi:hypothetical protein